VIVTKYDARCVSSVGGKPHMLTTADAARKGTVVGLSPEVSYSCAVRAYDANGPGPWSSEVNATTLPAGSPDAPAAPTSGAGGNPKLIVWLPPKDNGGSPVTSYELRVSNWWAGAGVWVSLYKGLSTQFQIANADVVLPDMEYDLQVRAITALGESSWSPSGKLKLEVAGRCGNTHDVTIFHDQQSTISGKVGDAIMGCITNPSPTDCIAGKLHDSTGLSQSCGLCWGQDGICVENSCFKDCVLGDKHGPACVSCSKAHCTPAMLECAGLPDWVFPTK